MKKNVNVNKIIGSKKSYEISMADYGFITNNGGCVAVGYKAGNRDYSLSVSVEDMLTILNNGWIPVDVQLPEEKINPFTYDYYEYECTFETDRVTDVRHYKFGGGHWWHGGGCVDEYVTAWKPLPEPYKKNQ